MSEIPLQIDVSSAAGFSDIPDAGKLMRLTVRLLIATLLGFKREQQVKAAGWRTHILVAIGPAMFKIVASRKSSPQKGPCPIPEDASSTYRRGEPDECADAMMSA